MRTKKEIEQALKDMEVRRKSAMLDMCEIVPNGVKYDTEIITRIQNVDVIIHTLKWILQPKEKKTTSPKQQQ